MGEQRKKSASVLLKIAGKTVKLELFPASEWPGEPDAAPGTYRVRQDMAWVRLGGEKYSFLTREALAAHLAGLLFGGAPEVQPPAIPSRSRVRLTKHQTLTVPNEDPELAESHVLLSAELTWTSSPVFQGPDGQWRVCVVSREEPVLVTQIEVVP